MLNSRIRLNNSSINSSGNTRINSTSTTTTTTTNSNDKSILNELATSILNTSNNISSLTSSSTPSTITSNSSGIENVSNCNSTLVATKIKDILQKDANKHKREFQSHDDMTNDFEQPNGVKNKKPTIEVEKTTQNDANQQTTLIIEGGLNDLNGLHFQLKPSDANSNRQITLKVVPLSTPSATPSTSTNSVNQSGSQEQLNHLNDKKNTVNSVSSQSNSTTASQATTTTVSLSESNQNVYLMMQTPIDLINNAHLVQPQDSIIRLKNVTPSTSTSTPTILPTVIAHKPFNSTNMPAQSTATLSTIHIPGLSTSLNTSLLPTNNTTTVTLTSPLSSGSSSSPTKGVRDERRRANHNEVERRRRDNINKWIVELSKVIPDCSIDTTKHGQSKGGILEKTVQYLIDMRRDNEILREQLASITSIHKENEFLREQNELYKKEIELLRSKAGLNSILNNSADEMQSTSNSEPSTRHS